jgi:hypothetical protein
MSAVTVAAVILGSRDSQRFDQMNLLISIYDSLGLPLPGLMEVEVQVRLITRDDVIVPDVFFSNEEQATDQDGNPIFDQDGNPVMIRVPGAARPGGLPGFYRMVLNPPAGGWVDTSFVVEVAVSHGDVSGQAIAVFAEETATFRARVTSELDGMSQQLQALLTAYTQSLPLRLSDLAQLGGETLAGYLKRRLGP